MPNWSEEGFNKILEAAKRGREKIIAQSKEEYEQKKLAYDQNPNLCKHCENPLTYKQVLNLSTYCSRSCAAKFNNSKRLKANTKCTCLHCGKEYKIEKNGTGKYCSRECCSNHRIQERLESWLRGEVTVSAGTLRRYMALVRPHVCEVCGIKEWNNHPAPLEVDHIDGNPENNVLSNLRRICPNCHAQTDTYKAKNKGRGREHRRKRWHDGKTV
jgi:hypothetical protein